MARPSKLTEKQWLDIERRHLAGEGVRDLAREYDIAPSNISKRVSKQTQQQKDIANQLATAEVAFSALPISQQIATRQLADAKKSAMLKYNSILEKNLSIADTYSKIANDISAKVLFKSLSDDGETISIERLAECEPDTLSVMKAMQVSNEAMKVPIKMFEIESKSQKEPEGKQEINIIGGMNLEPKPYDYPLPNKSDDGLDA